MSVLATGSDQQYLYAVACVLEFDRRIMVVSGMQINANANAVRAAYLAQMKAEFPYHTVVTVSVTIVSDAFVLEAAAHSVSRNSREAVALGDVIRAWWGSWS